MHTKPCVHERRVPISDDYREMVWRIPLGVAILQIEHMGDAGAARIVSANPAALAMKDFTLQEVIGRTLRDVLPKALDRFPPERLAAVMQQGEAVNLGHVRGIRHPERIYAVKVFPLPRKRLGVLFEDVTQTVARAEAEECFRKAL